LGYTATLNILKRFFLVSTLCLPVLTSCVDDASTNDEVEVGADAVAVDDSAPTSLAADAARRFFFYRAAVDNVIWNPGCGQQPPPGSPPCLKGLTMTFTRQFADLEYSVRTRVNNAAKTLTIYLNTFSPTNVHPRIAVRPETIDLNPENLQSATVYKVKVVDRTGFVLLRTEVATYLAP
jgi:hypothetical protein